jgi:hypothetical protein
VTALIEVVGSQPEAAVARLYQNARLRADDRHIEFDGDTSGTYDPESLERWVRWAEAKMKRLCSEEDHCPVRLEVVQ